MKTRIVETREEFTALRSSWNGLVDRIDDSEAFFSWEWADARLDHGLAAEDQLFIVVVENGDELLGIAPLCIQRAGAGPLAGRVARTLTGDPADYGSFYLDPGCNHRTLLAAILETLREHRHRWDLLHLLNFSSRNPQTFLIADLAEGEFGLGCTLGNRVLTPYIRLGENEAKIARSRLKTIERRERVLHRDHQVEMVIDGKFSEEFWARFVEFHLAKWPESVFRDPVSQAFMRQVIASLEPLGKTDISWLKVDGKFAAMHLGFKTRRKISYYIPVLDQHCFAKGVGGILLKNLIGHYTGEKREFDLLRGNESYKFHWTDSVAANHDLLVGNGSAKSRALSRYLRAKDRLRGIDGLRKLVRAATGR